MRVAMDQRVAAGIAQPGPGRVVVDIRPGRGIALVHAALRPQMSRQRASREERHRTQRRQHPGTPHRRAGAQVADIAQAELIAMAQQPGAPERVQPRRIGEQRHAGVGRHRLAEREVPVAVHEEEGFARGDPAQQFERELLERAGLPARVVADPGLEDVAQQEDRIRGRGRQVGAQSRQRRRHVRRQVQVGDQVDPPPAGLGPQRRQRRRQSGRGRHGTGGGTATHSTATARSMMTASTGTSSWKPERLVLTFSILSTTSWPPTTLPNTA